MGIYVNPNNEGFKSALRSRIYVDKSMLIDFTNSILGTEQKYICITRPRRFGKSMAAAMLSAYYSCGCDSKELFSNLKIAKSSSFESELNKNCVIALDIQKLRSKAIGLNQDKLLYIQKSVIKELKDIYPDCVTDSDYYLPEVLLNIYSKTGTQFIIITDEWDCFFREDKEDKELIKNYLEFLGAMYKGTESDLFIKLAYMTGILPIKQYDVQSKMNNFDEYTMLMPFPLTEFIGFTEHEVKDICDKHNLDFDETKRWYDGYDYDDVGAIYNPNSVVKAANRHHFGSYWTATGTYESIKNAINYNFNGLRDEIISLLSGKKIGINPLSFENDMTTIESNDDIFVLLVHLGYLAYDSRNKKVYIPNKEIAEEFGTAIRDSYKNSKISEVLKRSEELIEETINGNAERVAETLELAHQDETSILRYNNEESLACAINIAYYYARSDYLMVREFPSGKGFADLTLIPSKFCDKPAMIIELKVDKDAETGIKQIKEKRYEGKLKNYLNNIVLVSINYDKETKKHSCVIEYNKH
jgi:hypothetical protein